MKSFATRVALLTTAFTILVTTIVSTILITSSVAVMRNRVSDTARSYALVLATQSNQRREMMGRIMSQLGPDGQKIRLQKGSRGTRPRLERDRGAESPPIPPGRAAEIEDNLAELATAVQASQLAVIRGDQKVVRAVTKFAEGSALSENEIMKLSQSLQDADGVDSIERRYSRSLVILTKLAPTQKDMNAVLLIEMPFAAANDVIRASAAALGITALIALTLSIILSIWLSTTISGPLSRLAQVADHYGRGDLSVEACTSGPTETRILGRAFNDMRISLRENIEGLKEETSRREALETELRIGAALQHSLLPSKGVHAFGTLQLLGWNQQAREVGGDFYNFWPLSDDKIAVTIGDVTGKGIKAALLAGRCLSVIETISGEGRSPAETLHLANQSLCRQFKTDGHFVTAVFAIIDVRASLLQCALAGHNPPCFAEPEATRPVWLKSRKGLPLGIVSEVEYEDISVRFESGSTLLLYTDGITEAFGDQELLYGTDRLEEAFKASGSSSIEGILKHLRTDLEQHRNSNPVTDDSTILLARA
jgi:phosphoserine phosphatase RsbU/P